MPPTASRLAPSCFIVFKAPYAQVIALFARELTAYPVHRLAVLFAVWCALTAMCVCCCGRYLDVVNRLDPVVVALEREDRPVMIISHQVQ